MTEKQAPLTSGAASYPTHSPEAFRAWVEEIARVEELAEVFQSGVSRLVLVALRNAPGAVVAELDLESLLEGYATEDMGPVLFALCANPTLTPATVERLVGWAMEEIRSRASTEPTHEDFSGREASLQVLHTLEAAGHRLPEDLLEPLWQVLRSPGAEDRMRLAAHAHAILECAYQIRPEDWEALYPACQENDELMLRLLRHPATEREGLVRIARHYFPSGRMLLEMMRSREEAREVAEIRRLFIECEVRSVYEAFLPYATSAEFVEMVSKAMQDEQAALGLLALRAPEPREMRAILEDEVSRRHPRSTLEVLERFGNWEAVQGMDPEVMVPLFSHPEGEFRLRAQRVWSRLGQGLRRDLLEG